MARTAQDSVKSKEKMWGEDGDGRVTIAEYGVYTTSMGGRTGRSRNVKAGLARRGLLRSVLVLFLSVTGGKDIGYPWRFLGLCSDLGFLWGFWRSSLSSRRHSGEVSYNSGPYDDRCVDVGCKFRSNDLIAQHLKIKGKVRSVLKAWKYTVVAWNLMTPRVDECPTWFELCPIIFVR